MATKGDGGSKYVGIKRRGDKWAMRVRLGSRDVHETFSSEELAFKRRCTLIADYERGRAGLPQEYRMTLADFAPQYMDWFKAHKKSADRHEVSLKALLPVFGKYRMRDITRSVVDRYMNERLKEERRSSVLARAAYERKRSAGELPSGSRPPAPVMVSAATVNREVFCLSALLSYAVKVGELDTNPIAGIEPLAEGEPRDVDITGEEEARLIQNLAPWARPVYFMAILTGLRLGELLNLRWRDVNFDTHRLIVTKSKTTRTRKVAIPDALEQALSKCRGEPSGFVVDDVVSMVVTGKAKGRKGEPEELRRGVPKKGVRKPVDPDDKDTPHVRPQSVSHAFKRAATAIGRGDLRWHDTRHFYATRFQYIGATGIELMNTLGHASIMQSGAYTHIVDERQTRLANALPVPSIPGLTPGPVIVEAETPAPVAESNNPEVK
ncbi:MAG TPA: tyrosine-type recombinase/integrase [Myxococcota bacterium]|nr:tyrosine-type recombinase/integrase [Myxococcota bacterium]